AENGEELQITAMGEPRFRRVSTTDLLIESISFNIEACLIKHLTAPPVTRRLSTLDRWLPLWIGLAMVAGLPLGRFIPGISELLSHMEIGGISMPIALGLLVMMYPVLAKVRYDKVAAVTGDKKLLISSLVLNWLAGPAIMFALAWLLLPDIPEYRT